MASIMVIIQHPKGGNKIFLAVVPDTVKVWQLAPSLQWRLGMSISAEIAIGEEVLIGNTRLEQVKENTAYTLTVIE